MSKKIDAVKVIKIAKKPSLLVEKERANFKKLVIQNPNYFGTFPEVEIKPVLAMNANTKYEEIKCVGFYPDNDLIEAVIDVKLSQGYNGSLCSSGSFEYVRFFVDWNGDGDFEDEDEDVGITRVIVHDIADEKKACLDKTKPISYALSLKIDSKKRLCNLPNLVKVRAILSWDAPPPEGNPNYPPVWGNVVDKWIQIKPNELSSKDIIKYIDIEKIKLDTSMLDLNIPISKPKKLSPAELRMIYKDKNVPELRFNLAEVTQTATKIKYDPSLMVKYKLKPQFSKLIKDVNVVLAEKPNTKYEQLHCVGLNYDLDTLVATLTVKQSYGFSGNLCTEGSYEYVAFWAYVYDQIEQMCFWRYLGTSSVNVHDIEPLPAGGLQYAVYLPVDLESYKDVCGNPKILKIRAILSWNNKPPTNDPNHKPVWGNTVEKLIQIKPVPKPGEQMPFISTVGGMAVSSISGNPDTILTSTIGDGYANGVSVFNGYTALESPFGEVIAIGGHISYPPDDPANDFEKLKYKVQYRKVGKVGWQDITNDFKIWISTFDDGIWSQDPKEQVAKNGYYYYEEDSTPPITHEVEGNVLAKLVSPLPEGDGLYEIRVLLYKLGAPICPGVPPDHICSNVVRIMLDNTRPTAEVFLDAGPCKTFTVGDVITGYFTATDKHFDQYSLIVEPSVADAPTIVPNEGKYPLVSAPGMPSGSSFALTTTKSTTPCGYVIHLHVWDRTIRNNHRPGWYKPDKVGLCLLEET